MEKMSNQAIDLFENMKQLDTQKMLNNLDR